MGLRLDVRKTGCDMCLLAMCVRFVGKAVLQHCHNIRLRLSSRLVCETSRKERRPKKEKEVFVSHPGQAPDGWFQKTANNYGGIAPKTGDRIGNAKSITYLFGTLGVALADLNSGEGAPMIILWERPYQTVGNTCSLYSMVAYNRLY